MVFRMQLSCLIIFAILLSNTMVSAKVIKKSSPLPSGNREYVFVRDGEEVAQQIVDEVSGEVVMTNGSIPDGPVHEYSSGGGLKKIWQYRDGLLEGITKEYDTRGRLAYEWHYRWGTLEEGSREFYPDGKVKAEFTFKHGVLQGPYREYYEGGQLRKEVHYLSLIHI